MLLPGKPWIPVLHLNYSVKTVPLYPFDGMGVQC